MMSRFNTIRYDTVDLRALKSWRNGQLNLAHGPKTTNFEEMKILKKWSEWARTEHVSS